MILFWYFQSHCFRRSWDFWGFQFLSNRRNEAWKGSIRYQMKNNILGHCLHQVCLGYLFLVATNEAILKKYFFILLRFFNLIDFQRTIRHFYRKKRSSRKPEKSSAGDIPSVWIFFWRKNSTQIIYHCLLDASTRFLFPFKNLNFCQEKKSC